MSLCSKYVIYFNIMYMNSMENLQQHNNDNIYETFESIFIY